MTSHILQVEIHDRALDPAHAELHVRVLLDQDAPGVEVRGRLMGPRCPYASTVEIAYPLRPLRGQATGTTRTAQVIIPEPSFWDTDSPFLYQGPVELWQDGQRTQVVAVSHGLRQLTLGGRGLRLNGRPLTLHGLEVAGADEERLRAWRGRGVNLLVVPVREETTPVWALADRLGFLVLGRVEDAETTRPLRGRLVGQASCFGWLLPAGKTSAAEGESGALPGGAPFLLCPAEKASETAQAGVPFLVASPTAPASAPGLFGWVETTAPT